ncbi:hypothetical protein AURDEDRAFT_121747 [Auricularia subglabra TFB-10046 SS5]|nr:hypothetical protein AURDEDRAFT_121747 [Auricularia subglabra TFB-10046 SS5]
MSKTTRPNAYEAADGQQSPPQPDSNVSAPADGTGEETLVLPAASADEVMPSGAATELSTVSEPDGTSTPKPANAALAEHIGKPRATASPTTSEFEQAGFYPINANRTRKFPGTPSDRFAEEERRNARSSAMREKEPTTCPKFKPAPTSTRDARDAHDKRRTSNTVSSQPTPAETTGGSMLASFVLVDLIELQRFPPFDLNSQQCGSNRGVEESLSSAPATAVRASRPAATNANLVARSDESHAAPNRPPSPHFGHVTRSTSGSFTLSHINANKKEAILQQQSLARRTSGQRGPSPRRAESSAMGAARSADQPARSIKMEPISPFYLPKIPDMYYDSEEDQYVSPSEEAALRKRKRKREIASAARLQEHLDKHGFTEIPAPAPARPPAAQMDAMSISDSDSDSDDAADDKLVNGGVAINNPQVSEDDLAATAAMHAALSHSSIKVTTAGSRSPINGISRNHYWIHIDPDQRRAIARARGYKILARGISIIGHPEIDPRDPAMLAFFNKTIRDMFGKDCKARAVRLVAAVDGKPGENAAPDAFAIVGLTREQADFLAGPEWVLASSLQLELHDIDEEGSDHLHTWSGAMPRGPAALKGLTESNIMEMLLASLRLQRQDVILPRSPGVVTRQFVVNGANFLSTDNHRRFRDALANVTIDTHIRSRAEVWDGWHCIVCHSVTHPTGMCPSRILEGWAAAADELLRRLREKRNKQHEDDEKTNPRHDENKRGGRDGGRGGRDGCGGSSGGAGAQRGRKTAF